MNSDMKCPDCSAAMDLRQPETFNARWECPFDQQIVWVGDWTDDAMSVCNEPMINLGNDHRHRCQVSIGGHDIDGEENADIHVCECKYAWIVG